MNSYSKGTSLIEMVVYVAIAAVIIIVVVGSLIVALGSYQELKESRILNSSALSINDRLVQEIRTAHNVDTVGSIFDTNPGKLVLNTRDSVGAEIIREFSLSSSELLLKTNSVIDGSLSPKSVTVDSLIFHLVGTTTSKAISYSFSLTVGTGTDARTENYQNTAVLRGSYQGL